MKYYLISFLLLSLNTYSQVIDSSYYNIHKTHLLNFFNPQFSLTEIDTLNSNNTLLQYATQEGKGQFLAFDHKQLLNSNFGFEMALKRYSQDGIFIREYLETSDFSISSFFVNDKQNYKILAKYQSQNYEAQENGGILNFDPDDYDDFLLYPSLLAEASNIGKNRFFSIKQEVKLSPSFSFKHSYNIESNTKTFLDNYPNSGYYTNIYIDSLQTFDSTYVREVNHQLGLAYKNLSVYYLFRSNTSMQFQQIDSLYTVGGVGLDYSLTMGNLASSLYLQSYSKFYSAQFFIENKSTTLSWKLAFLADKQRISCFENNYVSNHYVFDNDFLASNNQQLKLNLRYKNLLWSNTISTKMNYVYLDQNRAFQQEQDPFMILSSQLNLNWNWKFLYGVHSIQNQFTNNAAIYRVPALNTSSTIYLGNLFFDDVLNSKLGVDLDYFSSYKADAYLPTLGTTHLQDQIEIGNQAYLTAFVSFTIHSFKLRFQFKNLTNYVNKQTYYSLPNYPIYRTPFELSINWLLQR